jgi:hypothetical protein
MEKVRVNSFPDLRKDLSNGGVVNANIDSYYSYKQKREQLIKEKQEKTAMREEINNMKQDIFEIKNMLTLLLDRK